MKDHAEAFHEIIFAATLPAGRGKVRVVLETDGNVKVLRVSRAGKRALPLYVPAHVSAFDLPYWFTSVLSASAPTIDPKTLSVCEADVRGEVPSSGNFLSVCVGQQRKFHRCDLLHFDPTKISSGCHGRTLGLSGPIQGHRFIRGSLREMWTVLLQTSSEQTAKALQQRILRPREALLSLDDPIRSVMAFNGRVWRTAGVTAQKVLNFAREHGLSLQQKQSAGPGLAFRVRGP